MAIPETKQAMRALVKLGVTARQVGKDGWQITDAGLVIKSDDLQAALVEAFDGSEKIPNEMSHLSFSDTMELVMELVDAVKEFSPGG